MASTNPQLRFSLSLANNLASLADLAAALMAFAEQAGWDDALAMQVNLVLEELIVNTISYGYPDGGDGTITVVIEANCREIRILLTDDGLAFNPFQVVAPDLSLEIADRPIGGLGIFLVKTYMDECDYLPIPSGNQIRLTKRLN